MNQKGMALPSATLPKHTTRLGTEQHIKGGEGTDLLSTSGRDSCGLPKGEPV